MQRCLFHIFLLLSIGLLLMTYSCSPKTLSIFFDGVPNPDDSLSVISETQGQSTNGSQVAVASAKENTIRYFFHMPYKKKECGSCHNTNVMGQLLEQPPGLCYRCHQDFSVSYSVLHAPVEAGECLACHKPHVADNNDLLLEKGQSLCFQCHDQEATIATEYHAEIADSDCTDCHNPHGGNERFILN